MGSWIHCFWLELGQNFLVAAGGVRQRLLTSWWPGRKQEGRLEGGRRGGKKNEEKEKKEEEEPVAGTSLQGTLPETSVFPLGDISLRL